MNGKPGRAVRCKNDNVHRGHDGNLLAILERDSILLKCIDRKCKAWTRLRIRIPGVHLDLRAAAIEQETMPASYRHAVEKASVVLVRGRRCNDQ